MIRKDFVSNSSSCSFVIENPKEICDKIDLKFFKLLSMLPSGHRYESDNGYISFSNYDKKFSKDIIEYFNSRFNINSAQDEVIINNVEQLANINVETFNMFKKLISECENITVSFGLNDSGEKTGTASIVATILTIMFKGNIELTSDEMYCIGDVLTICDKSGILDDVPVITPDNHDWIRQKQ